VACGIPKSMIRTPAAAGSRMLCGFRRRRRRRCRCTGISAGSCRGCRDRRAACARYGRPASPSDRRTHPGPGCRSARTPTIDERKRQHDVRVRRRTSTDRTSDRRGENSARPCRSHVHSRLEPTCARRQLEERPGPLPSAAISGSPIRRAVPTRPYRRRPWSAPACRDHPGRCRCAVGLRWSVGSGLKVPVVPMSSRMR
jgi:hypothetical protein